MNGHRLLPGNREREQNPAYGLLQPQFTNGPFVETSPAHRQTLWLTITNNLYREWLHLCPEERSWISGNILLLSEKQQRLHDLVTSVEGEDVCRTCGGACCGHGTYHPTVVTILAHFVQNQPLPVPEFGRSCPYLGISGCQFLPYLRPYNCLTFICDLIDERYTDEQRQAMLEIELELRAIYEAFDNRYSGSSLRGLMNRDPGAPLGQLLCRQNVLD